MMKRVYVLSLAAGLCFSPLMLAVAADSPASGEAAKGIKLTPDSPVLRINGRDVAKIWYDRILVQFGKQHNDMGGTVSAGNEDFRRQVLEKLVEQEMLFEVATKAGPPNLDSEIDQRVQTLSEKLGGKDTYLAWLKDQGMEERHLRYLLKRELSSNWYTRKVMNEEIKASEDEIKDFYSKEKIKFYDFPEKRKIYQILAAEGRGEEMAKKRLAEVVAQYNAKEKGFGELARLYSDEPYSRLQEGYIGERAKSELPDEVGEACFLAKPGELTPIVHSDFGYHVLLVTDILPPASQTLEQARPDVVERIKAIKADKYISDLLKKKSKETKIEILMHLK